MRCVFQSTKVGSYFSLKSKSPALLLSNVVYKYKCLGDPEQSYIGETTCHIVKRAGEHLDCFSERMPTGIGGHIQKCDPCLRALKAGDLSFRNFEILSRCQSKLEAEVREAFLVTKHKPTMNSQLFMSGASLTLKIFGWPLPTSPASIFATACVLLIVCFMLVTNLLNFNLLILCYVYNLILRRAIYTSKLKLVSCLEI